MADLYHWGIGGMKWGRRRWQYEDGSLTPEGRIHYGVGPARIRASTPYSSATVKDPHYYTKDMSDDELRKVLERLDMEKRYAQYMNEQHQDHRVKIGYNEVMGVLKDTTTVAGNVAKLYKTIADTKRGIPTIKKKKDDDD